MSDSATRDVIFKLKVEPGQGAVQNAERFGRMLEGTDARAFDMIDKRRATSLDRFRQNTREMVAAERRATSAIEAMISRRTELRRNEFPSRLSATDPASRPSAARTAAPSASRADVPSAIDSGRAAMRPRVDSYRADGEAAVAAHGLAVTAIQSEVKAGDKLSRSIVSRLEVRKRESQAIEAGSRLTEKLVDREHRDRERFTRESVTTTSQASGERVRIQQTETSAVARAMRDQEREADRLHKRHRERQKSVASQNRKARQTEDRDAERMAAQIERDMATATGRMAASNAVLVEGIASGGESLVRFATGLTALGLASEENNEKLLRGLVVLRGVNDTLAGGLNFWMRSQKVVEGYRQTLVGVAAAQEALNAKQALGALPVPGGRGGRAGGRAGARGAGGAVSGTAEFAAAQAGLSGLQKAALRLGGALSPLAAVLGKTAAGAAGAATTIAVGGAVIGDMMASLATTGSLGPRAGSVRESAVGGIGEWINSRAMGDKRRLSDEALNRQAAGGNSTAGAVRSERMVNHTEAGLDRAIAAEAERSKELVEQFNTERDKAMSALRPVMMEAERLSGEQAVPAIDRAQRFTAGREQAVERMDSRGEQGNVDAFGALAKAERLLELENQQLALIEKRGGIERETARTKLDAAREDLRLTEQSVERTEDKIRMLRESMLSDAERFADLDKPTQDRVLDIGRRMKAGEIVSTEDRGLARQYGGELGADMARKQAVDLTAQTDFGDVFQQGQQKRMEELRAKLEGPGGLQATLNDQRGIVVNYEQSAEEMAERMEAVVLDQLEQRDAKIIALFEAKVAASEERNLRNMRTEAVRKARGLSGG